MADFKKFDTGTWGSDCTGIICEIAGDDSRPDPECKKKVEQLLGNLFDLKFKIVSAIEFSFGIKVNITITGIEMLDKTKPEYYSIIYDVDGTDPEIYRIADFIDDRLVYLNIEFR